MSISNATFLNYHKIMWKDDVYYKGLNVGWIFLLLYRQKREALEWKNPRLNSTAPTASGLIPLLEVS